MPRGSLLLLCWTARDATGRTHSPSPKRSKAAGAGVASFMTHDQRYNRLHLQLDDVPNLLAINKMKPYHQPEGLQTGRKWASLQQLCQAALSVLQHLHINFANTCRQAWDARTADNRMTVP